MDMDSHSSFAQGIPSPDDHFAQQQQLPSPVSSQCLSQSGLAQSPDTQQQILQQQQSAGHSPTQTQAQQQQQVHMQNQQQRSSQQHPQVWPSAPHLLQTVTTTNGSPFPSPSPSSATLDHSAYPFFHAAPDQRLERAATTGQLSLNISSLSVTSPSNLSPITPSPHPSTASTTLSPITPLSPSTTNMTPQQHAFTHRAHAAHQVGAPVASMFAYVPPGDHTGAPGSGFDMPMHASHAPQAHAPHRSTAPSSRSSSSSGKSIPRKRSFTGAAARLPIAMEESIYEPDMSGSMNAPLDLTPGPYDDIDVGYPIDSQGSPIEGSSSGGEHDEIFNSLGPQVTTGNTNDIAQSIGLMNSKPSGSNNFVSKLYQYVLSSFNIIDFQISALRAVLILCIT